MRLCAIGVPLLHTDIKDYFAQIVEICSLLVRRQDRGNQIHPTAANVCGMAEDVPVEESFMFLIFHPFSYL